jgi:hypothetical protein
MRYYWCVNCGYSHDYKRDKKRGISNCHNCDYDSVLELDHEEWDIKSVTASNKLILKDGRVFIGETPSRDIDSILKSIKDGTYGMLTL